MLRYIYKARNTPPPYPVRTDALIKVPPLSQGLASQAGNSKGVRLSWVCQQPPQPCFPAPVTRPFSQALALLLPFPAVKLLITEVGVHPGRFTLRRCRLHLWWGQMAAGTIPTPCLEVRVLISETLTGAGAVALGIFFWSLLTQKQNLWKLSHLHRTLMNMSVKKRGTEGKAGVQRASSHLS